MCALPTFKWMLSIIAFYWKASRFSRLERGDNACKWKVEKREKSSKFQVANYSIFNQLCKICYCRVELHACSTPWEVREEWDESTKAKHGKKCNCLPKKKKKHVCSTISFSNIDIPPQSTHNRQSIVRQRGDERAQISSIRLSYKQFSSVVGCYHLAAS